MNEQQHQILSLVDRAELKISGVSQAQIATESSVVIETSMGVMNIRGSKLHVEKLDTETGELYLTGNIQELKYAPAKKPFIKRLFK